MPVSDQTTTGVVKDRMLQATAKARLRQSQATSNTYYYATNQLSMPVSDQTTTGVVKDRMLQATAKARLRQSQATSNTYYK